MNETNTLLALLNETFPDISEMDPIEARSQVDARIRPAANLSDAESVDRVITTAAGPLNVRIYHPVKLDARLPVTLYAHGGGFLHGSIDGHDGFCRRWAKRTGMIVVSVDYRLAPEAGAPAASDDMMSVAEWVTTEGMGNRFVLAGDSSGANVAAVTALTMRHRPGLTAQGQVLIYPFLDPAQSSPSYKRLGDTNFVKASTLATYWRHYLDAPGTSDAADWQVNPALATDLRGLPNTVVVTAGLDPLAHEGREFARAIGDAGIPTTHRFYPGQFHGFLTIMSFGPALAAQETLWSDISHITHAASASSPKE